MRIVIISRSLPYVGGREIVVEYLINELKKKHSVLLITPDFGTKRKHIKTVTINQNIEDLRELVKKFNADIINCHTFYFFDLAKNLSESLHIPLVFTFHGMFLRFYKSDYRSLIKNICKFSAAVTVVSSKYKDELVSQLGVSGSVIKVIRNGIPKRGFMNVRSKSLKTKYGISLNRKLVVIPARINKIKGLRYLIAATKKMKDDNLFFLICSPKGRHNKSEGTLRRELLRSLDARTRLLVRFVDCSHSDLQKIFYICEVCFLPSLMEGISISILEAMSMGRFVIATNVGGTPEVIKNGFNGFLIKPKNQSEIVNSLRNFENLSERIRVKIKINSERTVSQYFSLEKMTESYQKLFSDIIKKYESK